MPGRTRRLFVAVYPPEDLAREMLALAQRTAESRGAPAWRETPVRQVHLTLQFIGDRREGEVEQTVESVRRSAAGLPAFELAPLRLITLPERTPTRLIAVETDAPAGMVELQRRLAARLAKRPRRDPGARFRPHLTMCRFLSESGSFVLDEPMALPAFVVERIVVVESVLRPGGAEHRDVERVPLVGSSPGDRAIGRDGPSRR